MISRIMFVGLLDALKAQSDRDDEIARAVDVVVKDGANRSVVFVTPLATAVVEALDKEVDQDGVIAWWIWDGPNWGRSADRFAIHLPSGRVVPAPKSAGELYDYIVEQME